MTELKKWKDHSGVLLDTVNGYDIIECRECLFKHAVPITTEDELVEYYKNEFYSKEKPKYFERMIEDLDWWNLCYDDRYDSFEELLPKGQKKILDIGSGPGYFLKRGNIRGWKAYGIEPSLRAYEHSKKLGRLEIINDFFNEHTTLEVRDFDVIHMSDVLEHLPNPAGVISLAHELLKPSGLLCIVLPNDYNPLQEVLTKIKGYEPWWVSPPQHINYFSFDSLEQLLERKGFSIVIKESTFPIDLFLLMGMDYVNNDTLGRECHALRKEFEHTLNKGGKNNLKRQLYREMSKLNIGREIIMIGKKNTI